MTNIESQPTVRVGIITSATMTVDFIGHFADGNGKIFSGSCSFSAEEESRMFTPVDTEARFAIRGVVIGVDFHWRRTENQIFDGALELLSHDGVLTAINHVKVEHYLLSVISSEMSATAPIEFLSAHAVISRSWLLAQMQHGNGGNNGGCVDTPEEVVKWWDHDNHTLFDVCADDHCQRYQGLARAVTPHVHEAIFRTSGLVLADCDGRICDARFSKCCGGAFEKFSTCWQPVDKPYLRAGRDILPSESLPDLCVEAEAQRWIETKPASFCNTRDTSLLKMVLNSYDLETTDFYRWKVEYDAATLADIVKQRTGIDYGLIRRLTALHRGTSGRIDRMLIEGTRHKRIIGKELEIRRTLSTTHLYSSAFVAIPSDTDSEGIPHHWTLRGAGWGHGVGLCQIGAAVMACRGYNHRQILQHYFPGAELTRLY